MYGPVRTVVWEDGHSTNGWPPTRLPPYAVFTADPIEGMVPLTVTFTDISIGSVKERIWSFGDKTESKNPIAEHTYTKAGTYPISLTVTGYDGTIDRSAGFITVFPLHLS